MSDLIVMLVYILDGNGIIPHITLQDIITEMKKENQYVSSPARPANSNESLGNPAEYSGVATSSSDSASRDAITAQENSYETKE